MKKGESHQGGGVGGGGDGAGHGGGPKEREGHVRRPEVRHQRLSDGAAAPGVGLENEKKTEGPK